MDFLIRFGQAHETFRLPEIKALAIVEGVDMTIVSYDEDVRFALHICCQILTFLVTFLYRSIAFRGGGPATHPSVNSSAVNS